MRAAQPVRLTAIVEVLEGLRLPSTGQLYEALHLWRDRFPNDIKTRVNIAVIAQLPDGWRPNLIGLLDRIGTVLPARRISGITARVEHSSLQSQPRILIDAYWVELVDEA